jgi:hypothetical protein
MLDDVKQSTLRVVPNLGKLPLAAQGLGGAYYFGDHYILVTDRNNGGSGEAR